MLSKEECEKALNELITNNIYNLTNKQFIRKEILENKKMSEEVLNQLIQEHFKLVDDFKFTESLLNSRIKQLEYLLEDKDREFIRLEVYDK